MDTLMIKESNFALSNDALTELRRQGEDLLETYYHGYTDNGMNKIMETWAKAKGWLIDLFSKHEGYVKGKYYIKLPGTELIRPVDMSVIRDVVDWSIREVQKIYEKKQLMVGMFTMREYTSIMARYREVLCEMSPRYYTWKGMTYAEIESEVIRMENVKNKVVGGRTVCSRCGMTFLSDVAREYDAILDVFYQLERIARRETPNILDEEMTKQINQHMENTSMSLRAHVGTKTTKFYGKLWRELGMDKIVDIHERTWYVNGEEHTRKEDWGYNKYRALLGDNINPMTYKRDIYISVNPIDFWTMSFGVEWASCHTIDKENDRNNYCSYSGEWCGGTESYMLDSSTFIVYVTPDDEWVRENDEEDLPIEERSKLKRCVFYMGEDKLFQSRVYPDGRDGGDEGISTQLRNIVQKTIAELYETNNFWTVKKGTTSEIRTAIGATHYEDYKHYSDCTTSYLHRINGDLNHELITVGHKTICPACGNEHSNNEWLNCDSCRGEYTCYECGGSFDLSYDGIRTEDEHYFCCDNCAENAGYVFAYDREEWLRKGDCYYDDYDNHYYYDESWRVNTEEGRSYYDDDHAKSDGNSYADYDDVWTCHEEDVVEIGNCSEIYFYIPYHDNYVVTDDGLWYPDADMAREAGYELDEDDCWVLVA